MEQNPNRLVIEMDPNGRVNVSGPIGNKMLCYAMLECAKDAIREYMIKNQSPIVIPTQPIVGNGN
jgi:hypothetical protein